MQVSASTTSLVRQLHQPSRPSSGPVTDRSPSAVARPAAAPVAEPPLAGNVRIATEEIAARRTSDRAVGESGEAPHSRLRARLADLDRMVRKRLARFADSRGAEDPQLRGELRSISRTFQTALREAWKAFLGGDSGRAGLMREVRAAFEMAESGLRFAVSSPSGNEPNPVLGVAEGAGSTGLEAPAPEAGGASGSPVPGVTVTVTKAPPPAAGPAPAIEPQAEQVTDLDPLRALQEALEDLAERFETQMKHLHEMLTEAFGGGEESEDEPATDRAAGFDFNLAAKLYAELRLMAGNSVGGTLDIAS